MTETSMNAPGTEEPLILERLSDLDDQDIFLTHFPDIRGHAVVNPKGDEVGIIDDLYVNPRNQQIVMAAITFNGAVGYGGKKALIPVAEVQILDGKVRIISHEEKVKLSPDFYEGAPSYEPYYEYWSSQTVGPTEEPSRCVVRPPGRLELEGYEKELAEEEQEEYESQSTT